MSTPGDPSTSGGGPDRPCGITSLLPIGMSCRGRAEAFARSLQSRLRTLGTQGNADEAAQITDHPHENESTWLSQDETAEVTRLQPLRMVANEADSFFDFGMENESPGSPIEECEYTRLIETATVTPAEAAPESGYVCASPCSTPQVSQDNSPSSQSSSDCQFFDPVSSDQEQKSTSGCEYYDCTTSDPSTPPNKPVVLTTVTSHTSTSAKVAVGTATITATTSRQTRRKSQNGHLPSGLGADGIADSDSCSESLPPSQSTESRSHDSTFTGLSSNNSNSTLQDVTMEVEEANEGILEGPESSNDLQQRSKDETDHEQVLSSEHAIKTKSSLLTRQEEVYDIDVDVLSFINGIAEDELEEEKHSSAVEPTAVEQKLEDCTVDKETEEKHDHKREGMSSGDEDEEFVRPQRVRRCSSLKTGKTPPGTPGRKKFVRFADVLGLDLADVKTFVDEVPKIPKQAYEDLDYCLEAPAIQEISLGPKADRVLVPLFQQPGSLSCFLDRVREKQVNLENAAVTDPVNLTIIGTVRVRNLDFYKSVYVRYTTDNWRSFSDLQACYVENSCDGFSDKFTFTIHGNSVQIGQRIEMAIRFHCQGQQFWDNNYDTNYVFQCLPISQPKHIANLTIKSANQDVLLSPDEVWCKSFY